MDERAAASWRAGADEELRCDAEKVRRTTLDPEGDRSPDRIRDRELRRAWVSLSLAFPDFSGLNGDPRLSVPAETGSMELETVAIGRKLRDEAVV